MSNGLNIPSSGELDLISLGALIHRLDPGIVVATTETQRQS